jgi:ubiquinone/menaquinone biosynthesis C-methylase UbiE
MQDPTQRFSDRAENYIKYRPTYPQAVIETLVAECHLTAASIIADVGSGTGILAKLFLDNGNRVLGIEPNREMREAGERLLSEYPGFTSVAATAESTTLPDHSVDFVAAGQAFHWFDQEKTRAEFARILKPGGWVVLVWNDRRVNSTPFLEAYEKLLLTWALDYHKVNHRLITDKVIAAFFQPGEFKLKRLANQQLFDLEGVKGRLLSSSYAPEKGHPNHVPMLNDLRSIFQAHQVGGQVSFEYDTLVYYGQFVSRTFEL